MIGKKRKITRDRDGNLKFPPRYRANRYRARRPVVEVGPANHLWLSRSFPFAALKQVSDKVNWKKEGF